MRSNQGIESYGTYRPGRSDCECQYSPHTRNGAPTPKGWCSRIAGMHNGMFLCGNCWNSKLHRVTTFGGKDPFEEFVR